MNDSFSTRRRFLQGLGMVTGALATGALGLSYSESHAEGEPETASSPEGAILHGPYIPQIGADYATIMWATAKPTAAWAEIWRTDKPGSKRKLILDSEHGLKRTRSEKHKVKLTGLEPGATYAYKVFAGDRGRKGEPLPLSSEKEDGSFRTLNPTGKTCEVFIANDIHADKPGEDKLYKLLQQGVDLKKTDFCLLNGDIVSYLHKDGQLYEAIIDPMKEYARNLPIVYVRGNHENRGGMSLTLPEYFPPNTGEEYYYLLRQGPVCFVALDAGEDKDDTRKELGGVTDFAPYLEKEAEWLKRAVKSREFKTAKYRVLTIHIPALAEEGYAEKLVRQLFVPTLAKAGLDIMIAAHTHKNYFFPARTEKDIPFPILVNDNEGFVTLSANGKEMKVEHFDKNAKSLRVLKFPPR